MKKVLLFVVGAALVCPAAAFAFDDETNKEVLKDALVGAVTGYVAVAATQDTPQAATPAVSSAPADTTQAKSKRCDDASGKHKAKGSHRPPGWDKGKKTGWEGGDVPPGLRK